MEFNGRVAIITGAGGGLGREYSTLLASRGCSILVNDMNKEAADSTVKLISELGGKAIANYSKVEDGQLIVKAAIDTFGRVDIVINNAGILRDKSFTKMTDQEWDVIHQVHLRAAFIITRAAWPYMKEANYGRVIMTSSSAGIYGNFGQANYSAAKMGLVGLSNTLAVEGAKYNIHCNVIIPIAASNLTSNILPEQMLERLKPAYVAPVVAYLCHESCEENGQIFEASGGWVAKYKLHRSHGKVFGLKELSLESLRANWSKICSMEGGAYFNTVTDHLAAVMDSLEELQIKSKL